jgi:hypothetical protein
MPVPPVVEVDGGVVAVLVTVEVPAPVSVLDPLRPVWPPPLGVVVPPTELESGLESELELESVPEPVVDTVEVDFVPVDLATGGAAMPVVGTVSGGAPLVSLEPAPLPPQAATATAARTAADAEANTR